MVYLTCAVIGLGGRGVIKTWTKVAARVCLYMLTSHLTSLFSPHFSHWLQVRKKGTVYLFICLFKKRLSGQFFYRLTLSISFRGIFYPCRNIMFFAYLSAQLYL